MEIEVNKIYNCDFKKIMQSIKDESVDMVLTDIPYMLTKKTNLDSIKQYNKKSGSSSWENPNSLEWDNEFDLDKYLKECCRILKKTGVIIVWASWQQLAKVDKIIKNNLKNEKGEARIGIWKKTNPDINNMDKMALQPYELFIWNRKGKKATFNNLNGKYFKNNELREHPETHFYEVASPNNKTLKGRHPTSKPESIFEWLICTYSNKDDIIFDGCIGGGTTAVAAYKNKRQFIGIEKEKQYCEIAKQRLEKYKLIDCIVKEDILEGHLD